MPSTVHSGPMQWATTATPDQDVKENITPTLPLNISQASRKKNRMSSVQLVRLESLFQNDTHPSKQKKRELVDELGVDYRTLTIWFQNKRQTVRRNGGSVPFPPSRSRHLAVSTTLDQHVLLQCPSIVQSISSPSKDNTLQPIFLPQACSEANARTTPSPEIQGTVVDDPPLRKSMEVKPLLSSMGSFITPRSPLSSNVSPGKNQAQSPVASRISAQELWRHLSSSPAIQSPTPDRECEARESARDGNDTPSGKRRMTLEWACDREAKLNRGASHHSSDTDGSNGLWVGPSSQTITSALSLLSFATGEVVKSSAAEPAPSPDVIRGAFLLLSFKHSSGRCSARK